MRKKDVEELKMKSAEELSKLLREHREELRNLRFDLSAGKVKNVASLHKTRKAVARILTFLRMKQHEN
jgi:ribosomal protein L29